MMISLLRGHVTHKIRSLVVNQIGLFFEAGVFNQLKAALHISDITEFLGLKVMDPSDKSLFGPLANAINSLVQKSEDNCQSHFCKQITTIYSKVFDHHNLNTATHDTLHEFMGLVNIQIMKHMAHICLHHKLQTFDNKEVISKEAVKEYLNFPICFLHGEKNVIYLPEGTEKDMKYLEEVNPRTPSLYKRHLYKNYGHLDCLIGKRAVDDVYPDILAHLEQTAKE